MYFCCLKTRRTSRIRMHNIDHNKKSNLVIITYFFGRRYRDDTDCIYTNWTKISSRTISSF